MSDALTSCPKCGFTQPVDQYCANCGVDMLQAKQKSASSFASIAKQPGVIAGVAVAAIAITFGATKLMRRAPTEEGLRSSSLSSQSGSQSRRENLRAEVSPEMRRTLDARIDQPTPAPDAISNVPNGTAAPAELSGSSNSNHPTPAEAANGKSIALSSKLTKTTSQAEDGLLVAFAWTEVSHEWLQALGAADPGLHRIADLEGKLRASAGSFRILEVSKQKITPETTSFTMQSRDRGGNRTAMKVDISSLSDSGLAGSIQMNYRGPDGGMRAPAAAAMAIEKGQGSILTFASGPPAPGVSPTANEIVVLILPRWGADRNP